MECPACNGTDFIILEDNTKEIIKRNIDNGEKNSFILYLYCNKCSKKVSIEQPFSYIMEYLCKKMLKTEKEYNDLSSLITNKIIQDDRKAKGL